MSEESFVRFRTTELEKLLEEQSHLFDDLNEGIISHERELVTVGGWSDRSKIKEAGRLTNILTQMRVQRDKVVATLLQLRAINVHEEYRLLLSIPRVIGIAVGETLIGDVRHQALIIQTDHLYGKDEKKSLWRKVGAFQITIPLRCHDPKLIRWINRTRKVRYREAPSGVECGGHVNCLGNAYAPLMDAMREKDYYKLVALAVRYPECTGRDDHLKYWPRVLIWERVPSWYIQQFGK